MHWYRGMLYYGKEDRVWGASWASGVNDYLKQSET